MSRFTETVLRAPRIVMALCFLLCMVAEAGLPRLTLSSDTRVFFDPKNPELHELQKFESKYGQNNSVLMVVWAGGKKVTTPETLAAIGDLTARAWKLPYSTRVESLTNFPHVTADADSFAVDELVPHPDSVTPEQATEIERVAVSDDLVRNRLLAADAKAAGVLINFNLPPEGSKQVRDIIAASRALARATEAAHPGVEVKVTGNVILMGTFSEAAVRDARFLIPVSLAVTALIMMIFVRAIKPSLAILTLLILSSASAMGIAGWFNYVINLSTIAAPIIIMTVNMAAAVRIVTTTMAELGAGRTKLDAIRESLRIHVRPVTMTNATSALGFLSMNLADAPPFVDLGNIVAMGIGIAYVMTFTWLPAMLLLMPLTPAVSRSERLMIGLGHFVNRHYAALFVVTGMLVVASCFWLGKITLDDDFQRYFDKRFDYRQASDFAEDHLTGLNLIEFDIGSGHDSGVYDPDYQRKVAAFAVWLRAQPRVVSVLSLPDITRRINKTINFGKAGDQDTIPDNSNQIAQYFLLYEMSLPYGASITDQINVSRSSSRVTAILAHATASEIRATNKAAQAWLAANAPPQMQAKGISINVLFSHLSWENIRSMIGSTIVSMLLIAVVVGVVLRSVTYGLLSIVMNVLPSVVGFGLWGLFIGQLGLSAAVITAMTIGLVVDDTIYFLLMYQAARKRGLNAEEANNDVFVNVGVAMLVITSSLAVGFGVLMFSGFEVNYALGAQTSIIIVANLFIDWMMLPPLLRLIDGKRARASLTRQTHV
ncbi:MMPL family transporter [Parvibaculum sedimenti]|uniref:MMPL family transporter n=1 Tax=Parvibaculum sedimenti TaxID=2608632 RepID=A0A6N6VCV1_9HYPH|nr:MMPL family transporter [Parvibaculum sedimenti]KAB7738545.1 MMPL family transporter [Parvibaculum sedimenti]